MKLDALSATLYFALRCAIKRKRLAGSFASAGADQADASNGAVAKLCKNTLREIAISRGVISEASTSLCRGILINMMLPVPSSTELHALAES